MTSRPKMVMCDSIAPAIIPVPRIAPIPRVEGISISMDAINSAIPEAYLPTGSNPIFVKMYTDSSAPENLKYNVCSIMIAAIVAEIQEMADIILFTILAI